MDNKSLTCPKCGAVMTLEPEESEAICSYCGNKMIMKREKSDAEKVHLAKELAYSRELGRRKAQEEAEKQRHKRKIKMFATAIVVVAVLIGASALFTKHSKPEVNPFDYVEITFNGINGQGKASAHALNGKDDTDVSDFQFEVSPSSKLSEGDTVTVNVSSKQNKYRFTSSSAKYTVEGLQLYLTDLNSLNEEQLETITAKSNEAQALNLKNVYSNVQVSEITPIRLCLMTDNYTVSNLYVISVVTCTRNDESTTHYLISEMDDAIVDKGNISLGYCVYHGNIAYAVEGSFGGAIFSCDSLEAAVAYVKSSDASLTYSERILN